MPTNYFPAQIEQLKRKAKLLAASLNVPHSAGLDRVAVEEGFANWSLLMKHSSTFLTLALTKPPYRFERSDENWLPALRKLVGGESRKPELYGSQLDNICSRLVAPYNAATFALDYMRSLLARTRFRVPHGSLAYMEMRWWLPYVVHDIEDDSADRIVLNRHYKPVGHTENEHVEYQQFEHLHVRVDFRQLKSFCNRGVATGYLYDDGNAPWSSRNDALEYVARLEQLSRVLIEASNRITCSSWTYSQNEIYEALLPWARIPTWYTSHPADEKRLHAAVEILRQRVAQRLREEDIRVALRQHREENTEILGGKASDTRLEAYVHRIMGLLNH